MKNKARITIRISQELKARLKTLADRLKCCKSDIAREGIEKQVKKLEKR